MKKATLLFLTHVFAAQLRRSSPYRIRLRPGRGGKLRAHVRLARQLGDPLSASGRPLPGSDARPQPDQREGGSKKRWPCHRSSAEDHCVQLRSATNDVGVFSTVFTSDAYDLSTFPCWPELTAACANLRLPVVLDLGANVGYVALALHLQLPRARILAVEPEAANFEQLCRNVAGIEEILPLRAAVASHSGFATITNPDTNSTGFQTALSSNCLPGSVPAYSISELWKIAAAGQNDFTPLLVKMDVEGAERDLFAPGCDWLQRTPLLIVEAHDFWYPGQGTSHGLLAALAERKGDVFARGENFVAWSPDPLRQHARGASA